MRSILFHVSNICCSFCIGTLCSFTGNHLNCGTNLHPCASIVADQSKLIWSFLYFGSGHHTLWLVIIFTEGSNHVKVEVGLGSIGVIVLLFSGVLYLKWKSRMKSHQNEVFVDVAGIFFCLFCELIFYFNACFSWTCFEEPSQFNCIPVLYSEVFHMLLLYIVYDQSFYLSFWIFNSFVSSLEMDRKPFTCFP